MNEHIETVIIGAGQAGLSTGYHLKRRGRPFVILDGNARVGDNWRQQWDTLRLYTPVKYNGLPGMPFPGEAWSYPQKDEVAAYLERYAVHWDLPVRMSTRVAACSQASTAGTYSLSGTAPLAAITSSWLPEPSGVPRPSRTSPTILTRRSCSCTRASTVDPTSSGPGGFW